VVGAGGPLLGPRLVETLEQLGLLVLGVGCGLLAAAREVEPFLVGLVGRDLEHSVDVEDLHVENVAAHGVAVQFDVDPELAAEVEVVAEVDLEFFEVGVQQFLFEALLEVGRVEVLLQAALQDLPLFDLAVYADRDDRLAELLVELERVRNHQFEGLHHREELLLLFLCLLRELPLV